MPVRSYFLVVAGFLFAGAISLARAEESAEPGDAPVVSGGGDECCQCCTCPVCPWEAEAGFVLLQRAGSLSQMLVRGYVGPRFQQLDDDQHGFTFQGGPDLTIIRHGDLADIEFRWFQVRNSIAGTLGFGDGFGFTPLGASGGGDDDFYTQYVSELSSFELNFKRPVNDWMAVFAGFRFVELDENVTGITSDSWQVSLRSFNDLYGFQLGSDITLWDRGGRFRLTATGKGGIYSNFARNRAEAAGYASDFVDSASTTNTSFLGEILVAGTYQITSRLAARIGYQLTWLERVALLSQQESQLGAGYETPYFDRLGRGDAARCCITASWGALTTGSDELLREIDGRQARS